MKLTLTLVATTILFSSCGLFEPPRPRILSFGYSNTQLQFVALDFTLNGVQQDPIILEPGPEEAWRALKLGDRVCLLPQTGVTGGWKFTVNDHNLWNQAHRFAVQADGPTITMFENAIENHATRVTACP